MTDSQHPRPQLTRDRWIDLCGSWDFAYDDGDAGLDEHWYDRSGPYDRTITVPFPPESKASGIGDPGFHPVLWYRRSFHIDHADRTGRVLIHFGAVDYRATVWVNGERVAEHEGGHTPFSADITPALSPDDAEQVVVVRAEDVPGDVAQPRGKQFWGEGSTGIWYHRTSGIWQPVWLEPVPDIHLSRLAWTPSVASGTVRMRCVFRRRPEPGHSLHVKLRVGEVVLADVTFALIDAEIEQDIGLATAGKGPARANLLWSPESPTLIDAELTLEDSEGGVADRVRSYFGFRDVDVADGRFLLNGSPYFLRLVLEQGYWPDSHLSAPGPDALRHEAELTKELGFNGVRIHQKVEDPRFLYWCDRLGLLVWGEMAAAFEFSGAAVERTTREWIEVLRRDHSHPSIVAWVPFNESWGMPSLASDPTQQQFVRAIYHLTRAIDPSRPVISNDGWEHIESDIWSIHDYARSGDDLRQRYGSAEAIEKTLRRNRPVHRKIHLHPTQRDGQPIMITEYGGISYTPAEGENWYGYRTVDSPEAYLAAYAEVTEALLDSTELAGFCYTQLTDTEQETNGLLTADRRPKLDPSAIRAVNTRRLQ